MDSQLQHLCEDDYRFASQENSLRGRPTKPVMKLTVIVLALSMALKTKSYGKDADRKLVVSKPMSLPRLLDTLIHCGGNEKYTILPPLGEDQCQEVPEGSIKCEKIKTEIESVDGVESVKSDKSSENDNEYLEDILNPYCTLDPEEYLDRLLYSSENELKESIEMYNTCVQNIFSQRMFSRKDKKKYNFFRNQIKDRCGILKNDVTKLSNFNSSPEEFLIDAAKVLDPDSTEECGKASHCQPEFGKKQLDLEKRLKSENNLNSVQRNLRRLKCDRELKLMLFRDLGEDHRRAVSEGDLKLANKIKRAIKLELRTM